MKKLLDKTPRPIVVVRRKKSAQSHHSSGLWKIAYADFITSMMAFFLVMWLINITDDKAKDNIANYFNPIKLVKNSVGKKGLNQSHVSSNANTNSPKYKQNEGTDSNSAKEMKLAALKLQESTMLQDPFYAIDKLSSESLSQKNAPLDTPLDQQTFGEEQFLSNNLNQSNNQNTNSEVDKFISNLYQDSLQYQSNKSKDIAQNKKANPSSDDTSKEQPATKDINQNVADNVADNVGNNVDNNNDTKKSTTVTKPAYDPDGTAKITPKMAQELKYLFAKNKDASSPNVEIKAETQGLRIVLSDNKNFGLFDIGSSKPNAETVALLAKVAKTLNNKHVKLIINGHTDARPYRSHTYDNWQLSTSRAQMTYYMLVRGGLDKNMLDHIGGYADSELKNAKDPFGAENRRIEILVIPSDSNQKSIPDIKFDNLDKDQDS